MVANTRVELHVDGIAGELRDAAGGRGRGGNGG